jgi:hypothetical protein
MIFLFRSDVRTTSDTVFVAFVRPLSTFFFM